MHRCTLTCEIVRRVRGEFLHELPATCDPINSLCGLCYRSEEGWRHIF